MGLWFLQHGMVWFSQVLLLNGVAHKCVETIKSEMVYIITQICCNLQHHTGKYRCDGSILVLVGSIAMVQIYKPIPVPVLHPAS
jgi:hypothetical protein